MLKKINALKDEIELLHGNLVRAAFYNTHWPDAHMNAVAAKKLLDEIKDEIEVRIGAEIERIARAAAQKGKDGR